MILTQLQEFRQAIYHCLGKARDAVFELMKLLTQQIPSEKQPLLVGDNRVWMRPDAPTLRERTVHR
ncbi:MAG: hypothetical protein ACKO24_04995 [Leptolyngbyaceae cyanobacterium]